MTVLNFAARHIQGQGEARHIQGQGAWRYNLYVSSSDEKNGLEGINIISESVKTWGPLPCHDILLPAC